MDMNGAFSHKTNYFDFFPQIQNLEGHQNCCVGSKVTAILLNVWIWLTGGVALWRVCPAACPVGLFNQNLLYIPRLYKHITPDLDVSHNLKWRSPGVRASVHGYYWQRCHFSCLGFLQVLGSFLGIEINDDIKCRCSSIKGAQHKVREIWGRRWNYFLLHVLKQIAPECFKNLKKLPLLTTPFIHKMFTPC